MDLNPCRTFCVLLQGDRNRPPSIFLGSGDLQGLRSEKSLVVTPNPRRDPESEVRGGPKGLSATLTVLRPIGVPLGRSADPLGVTAEEELRRPLVSTVGGHPPVSAKGTVGSRRSSTDPSLPSFGRLYRYLPERVRRWDHTTRFWEY